MTSLTHATDEKLALVLILYKRNCRVCLAVIDAKEWVRMRKCVMNEHSFTVHTVQYIRVQMGGEGEGERKKGFMITRALMTTVKCLGFNSQFGKSFN